MSSGKVHNRATIIAAVAVAFTLPAWWKGGATAAFIPGMLLNLLMSPDLDVDKGNRSYYLMRRYGGNIFEFVWKLYWWPYAKIVKHRSWISHAPVVGTAIRVAYGFAWLFYLWPQILGQAWFWWAFAGLVLADTLHWIMDL